MHHLFKEFYHIKCDRKHKVSNSLYLLHATSMQFGQTNGIATSSHAENETLLSVGRGSIRALEVL